MSLPVAVRKRKAGTEEASELLDDGVGSADTTSSEELSEPRRAAPPRLFLGFGATAAVVALSEMAAATRTQLGLNEGVQIDAAAAGASPEFAPAALVCFFTAGVSS